MRPPPGRVQGSAGSGGLRCVRKPPPEALTGNETDPALRRAGRQALLSRARRIAAAISLTVKGFMRTDLTPNSRALSSRRSSL
jgi:hypothetical protein